MRIAVFADEDDASCAYRALEPMRELTERGHTVWVNPASESASEIADFDAVLISRWIGEQVQSIARYMRKAGLAVLWDHDDAWHIAPHLQHKGMEAQRITARVKKMVGFADVVTTTSEPLAETYRALGARSAHVIENYLGSHFADLETRTNGSGIVLGWAAALDHQADWKALQLQPVVERLLDAHRDLRIETIGPLDLGLPPDRYTSTPWVPLDQLGAHLTRFDVGIAPIADIPFNRARSNIKVKEYAAAGVAWAASPIGPYVGLGERQGGRLVPDDRWYEELDLLIRKARLRRKLVKQGRTWARENMLEGNLGKWEAALADARQRAAARRGNGR